MAKTVDVKSTKIYRQAELVQAALRAPSGAIDVSSLDTEATPQYPGDGKNDVDDHKQSLQPLLDQLQEQMFAVGRTAEKAPSVLLVLQGMDTSGKGGVVRHVIGMVDPQGVKIAAFKKPTAEELRYDFLWRIRKQLPDPGFIGVFDRSHYEDVLVQRVEQLASPNEIERRYDAINQFEQEVVESGTKIIKCFLHISRAEQKQRLAERLEREDKHWKYHESDLVGAKKWPRYMEAFNIAIQRCNSEHAPWYIVPADRKWYRNWAICNLVLKELADLDLRWPTADFDVAEQKTLVEALPEK